jgi:uncharacterized alpha/beta hydrolase family protein
MMAFVAISVMFIIMTGGSFAIIANGQSQTTNTAAVTKKPLPVLLIYGYASDASAWSKW